MLPSVVATLLAFLGSLFWPDALVCVQLRTVIAWQRKRLREHWRCLSQQGTSGRPAL
jgi:hypothetical protein